MIAEIAVLYGTISLSSPCRKKADRVKFTDISSLATVQKGFAGNQACRRILVEQQRGATEFLAQPSMTLHPSAPERKQRGGAPKKGSGGGGGRGQMSPLF